MSQAEYHADARSLSLIISWVNGILWFVGGYVVVNLLYNAAPYIDRAVVQLGSIMFLLGTLLLLGHIVFIRQMQRMLSPILLWGLTIVYNGAMIVFWFWASLWILSIWPAIVIFLSGIAIMLLLASS